MLHRYKISRSFSMHHLQILTVVARCPPSPNPSSCSVVFFNVAKLKHARAITLCNVHGLLKLLHHGRVRAYVAAAFPVYRGKAFADKLGVDACVWVVRRLLCC